MIIKRSYVRLPRLKCIPVPEDRLIHISKQCRLVKVILHGTLFGSTLFAKVPVHGFLVYKKVNGAIFSLKVSLQVQKIEK